MVEDSIKVVRVDCERFLTHFLHSSLAQTLHSRSGTRGIIIGENHDPPQFDTSDPGRWRAFKYFLVNIRDFCIMEDFINPAKEVDSDK